MDGDVEALLIFLRNTSFGPEYLVSVIDPQTNKQFEATILLDELNINKVNIEPDNDGCLSTELPRTGSKVRLRFLTMRDAIDIERIVSEYPAGRMAPLATLRLSKMIVDIDGNSDRGDINKFVENMPIMDSKYIKNFMLKNEPKLDLIKEVIAPSGERVMVNIAFGVEFFRPFF